MLSSFRGLKDLEQDSSSMEKRFSYKFLKRLLKIVDSAQEFIAHLGQRANVWSRIPLSFAAHLTFLFPATDFFIPAVNPEAMATSGKTDKSPHDQEIKFFAKVCKSMKGIFLYFWSKAVWSTVSRNYITITAVLWPAVWATLTCCFLMIPWKP